MAVRFRIWRERTLPHAAYRLEARFWTPAGRQFAEGLPDWQRRACKNFEPRVTGIAWTSRRLYLVIATAAATLRARRAINPCACFASRRSRLHRAPRQARLDAPARQQG